VPVTLFVREIQDAAQMVNHALGPIHVAQLPWQADQDFVSSNSARRIKSDFVAQVTPSVQDNLHAVHLMQLVAPAATVTIKVEARLA
jgi:hypothetical protein